MDKKQIRNSFLLLLTATIWGAAFVAQSVAMDHIGPFAFVGIRNYIGALALVPVIFFLDRKKKAGKRAEDKGDNRRLLIGGVSCGVLLFIASSAQQIGLVHTQVGKAGFLTACYIVIVPLLGLFFGKRCTKFVWVGVAFALAGLYLLCMTERLVIEASDGWVLLCALVFSFQILAVDYFAVRVDPIRLACAEFFVCGILGTVCTLLFETLRLPDVLAAGGALLYAGLLSTGVGYTLQIVGQRDMNPAVASLIMSLESVMSVVAGFLLLHEALTKRELLGCAFMFCAIVLAQLPERHPASGGTRNFRERS